MNQWYYATDGNQQGPVSTQDLIHWLKAGNLQATTLVWRDGMSEWAAANQVPELASVMGVGQYDAPPPQAMAPAYAGPGGQAYAAGGTVAPAHLQYQATLGYAQPASHYGAPAPGAYPGGFWWRVLAYIIDYIILYIPNAMISFVLEAAMGGVEETATGGIPPSFFAILGLGISAQIALGWLYFACQESSGVQATLGKRACGLVVTDMQGQRLTFGRATGRYFGKLLSSLILCIGYIMIGFDNRKQGLHDKLASTLVWKKP